METDEVATLAARFYRKTLWVVETRAAAPPDALSAAMAEHLRYQIALEKRGVLFAAGPLCGEDGAMDGTGMILLRAASADEARAIADADPLHRDGLRSYTLRQWRMHEGRITISIDLSDSTLRLE